MDKVPKTDYGNTAAYAKDSEAKEGTVAWGSGLNGDDELRVSGNEGVVEFGEVVVQWYSTDASWC
ncbi:hypothetical protein PInf_010883 [Phytophthora infestans]|nr:hypothetical protein PInf_010883 [Phytophthora infestans]